MRLRAIILGFIVLLSACGDDADKGGDAAADADTTADSATEATPDTEPADTGPADTEPADTEPADTEPADTEPADTGPADTADTVEDTTDTEDTTETEVTPTGRKHVLCHDGGADAAPVTTAVPEEDVDEHLDHGDQRGPCSPLEETLVPESHTTIDCGGRAMTPADPSVDTFVFLHDVEDVHLVDCVVRFDFGLFIVGGGEHVIAGNEFHTASEIARVIDTDGNRFERNLGRFGGGGIVIERDSDDNLIEGNDLAPAEVEVGAELPGLTVPHERVGAASIVVSDHPDIYVMNAFINGELVQIPNRNTFCDGNVFRDNDIVGGDPVGIGVMVRSKDTLTEDNRVTGGVFAIASFGFPDGSPVELPGTCSLAADRLCGSDDDCDLEGYDETPLGTCEGASLGEGDSRVISPIFQRNVVTGEYEAGFLQGYTRDSILRDNSATGGHIGLVLVDYSIEAIDVTGNVFADNDIGLQIDKGSGEAWGANVSGNDFTGNTVGIQSAVFARVDGNYWGEVACPGFPATAADGLGADCAPFTVSVSGGVPAAAEACDATTRPHELDGICAFDAPLDVTVVFPANEPASFEVTVAFGYSGDFSVTAYGLADGELDTSSVGVGTMQTHPLDVAAGTRHLRLTLDGEEPGLFHDIDLVLFEGGCEVVSFDTCGVVAASFSGSATEQIDLSFPAAEGDTTYVIGIDPWSLDDEEADYALTVWAVEDGPANIEAETSSVGIPGEAGTVTVSWTDGLSPGTYLGVLDYANEYGPLRSTLVEVVLMASP